MSLFLATGSEHAELSLTDVKHSLFEALDKLGHRRKVLALPPDFTRYHSRAGDLTREAWQYYGDRLTAVMPALGTHRAMTDCELGTMFGDMPARFVPGSRLAIRIVHPGRSPRRVCARTIRRPVGLFVARASKPAAGGGRLRPDTLHRPGGSP